MKQKSLKLNTLIYAFRNIIKLVFPLITFPYVCRVLSVESVGKVNFSASMVNYFSLISALGIAAYGAREGAKIRDNREKLEKFVSELFTLNFITTILAYTGFIIYLLVSEKAREYATIMLIISINMPLTLIGVEWLFTVFEEYFYITIRSLVIQILSIFFLFIFVKNDTDIYWYTLYTVMVGLGSNIFNYFRIKKIINIKIIFEKNIIIHLKPILIFFAYAVAGNIYLNSDISILGYLSGDIEVGYYNASVKIYTLVKTILYSLITVVSPRLAYLYGNDRKDEYNQIFSKTFYTLMMLTIPATAGVFLLRYPIIMVLSGERYRYSADVLAILLPALPIGLFAGFISANNLIIFNQEKQVCIATIIAAVLNMVLNFIFIPQYGAKAAAFSTLCAESVVLAIMLYYAQYRNKAFNKRRVKVNRSQYIVASIIMYNVCTLIKQIKATPVIMILLSTLCGISVYFMILVVLNNEIINVKSIYKAISSLKNFINKKSY